MMVLRRVSVVVSGRELESLLEGLELQEACLARLQGACVPGVGLSRVLAGRGELFRLQGALVEAFAAGVDCEAGGDPVQGGPREPASAAVSAACAQVECRPVSPVAPERVLSAVEVAVPASVWQALRESVSQAEGVLRAVLAGGRVDHLAAKEFLRDVEALRRKWIITNRVGEARDEEVDSVRESCPGCGLWFERPLTLSSGSLCPVCVEERARGDQA
jgi:hypothetical protein